MRDSHLYISPATKPVAFSLPMPGSKSLANRALLLAGVAEGESALREIPDSDDIKAALSALSGLGVPVSGAAPGTVRVVGAGLNFPTTTGDIAIRSSGTVGRFLPGLLAAAPIGHWRVVASEQLARRPLTPLLDALGILGARVDVPNPSRSFPLDIRGGGLRGGRVVVSAAASSQFASGLLMAAPLAEQACSVTITDLDPEEAYIDLTLDLMRRFGVDAISSKYGSTQTVDIAAPQTYRATDFAVEADYNSALYFLALPLLLGGSARVTNLDENSGQPGRRFLSVLERLGASVTAGPDGVEVTAERRLLYGGFTIDMRSMSEMALTLGVLAVFADAPVTMMNLAHIRGHETDRLAVLAQTLAEVGVTTEGGTDWLRVNPLPRREVKNTVIDSRDDHRLAMSFTLLGLGANGLTLGNPGAVAKTFPDFFERLGACGVL